MSDQPQAERARPSAWVLPFLAGVVVGVLLAIGGLRSFDSFTSFAIGGVAVAYTIVSWEAPPGATDDDIARALQARLAARGIGDDLIRFTPSLALYPFSGTTREIRSDLGEVVAETAGLQLWFTAIREGSTFAGWPTGDTDHLEAARTWMNETGNDSYPQLLPRPEGAG